MNGFPFRLIGIIATLFTALINFTEKTDYRFKIAFLILAIYIVIVLLIDAYRSYKNREITFDKGKPKGKKKIASYLCKQLGAAGGVAIFSKDLTWVQTGSEAENLLLDKAKKNELEIFVEVQTPLAIALKNAGAAVYEYDRLSKKGFSPTSRFTILDVRTAGKRVMVGAPTGTKHVIKNYDKPDFEVVNLSCDFISLLKASARRI